MSKLEEILASAEQLSPSQKAELIARLWDRVAPESWPTPSEEWLMEIRRRSELIDQGIMPVDSWSNVRARARKAAGLDD